jgi:hypothetical protein
MMRQLPADSRVTVAPDTLQTDDGAAAAAAQLLADAVVTAAPDAAQPDAAAAKATVSPESEVAATVVVPAERATSPGCGNVMTCGAFVTANDRVTEAAAR